MKIINTTDKEISIQVKGGFKYTIEGNGELRNIPVEHAEFWKGLHGFLKLEQEVGDVVEDVKEEEVQEETPEVEEVKEEEVVEEVKEEVKETIAEKVKKAVKKKKVSKDELSSPKK